MSILASHDFLSSVEQLAYEMLADFEEEIVRDMVDQKGLAYGDVELSRQDRIVKFLLDDADGVNEALKLSNPDEYDKRLRQFQRDVQEAGLSDG